MECGQRFSASCIPTGQGAGRFDVPDLTPVWYLAETPAHAVAEILQGLRNQPLDINDLIRFGRPLALVRVTLDPAQLLDLCDPEILSHHNIRPDALAAWDFTRTHAIARQLYGAECVGFRWWSALSGDWHSSVVFHEKLTEDQLIFGDPEPLTLRSPAIVEAAKRLAITLVSE